MSPVASVTLIIIREARGLTSETSNKMLKKEDVRQYVCWEMLPSNEHTPNLSLQRLSQWLRLPVSRPIWY